MVIRKEYVMSIEEVKSAIVKYIEENVGDTVSEYSTIKIKKLDDTVYECVLTDEDGENA